MNDRHIYRRKRAHDDPEIRKLLDRGLSPDEIDGIEVVKSATPSTVKRATEVVNAGLLDHPDPEVRRGAAEILKAAGITKGSPLLNQTASRVRPGTPPAVQPLTATSAGGLDQLDVNPASAVDAVDIPHVHRHEGTAEKVRAYWHAHPHSHSVPHDPDDPNDVVDHDRSDHINDPRHVTALRGFGGWESKSAGTGPEDALKAIQADSVKVQGYVLDRAVPLEMINERLAINAESIRQLQMSAELAELRKGSQIQQRSQIQRLISEQAQLRQLVMTKAASTQRQAYLRRIHENAATIRKLAGGEVDWSGRLKRKAATADVQKAHVVSYDTDTDQLADQVAKTLKPIVEKALRDLDRRLDALNKRAR